VPCVLREGRIESVNVRTGGGDKVGA
jgi:hypothetical protein